jgi:hypothetical protein
MVSLVAPLPAVLLHETYPVSLDPVYRPDVNAVGADDFHVLLDTCGAGHFVLLAPVDPNRLCVSEDGSSERVRGLRSIKVNVGHGIHHL